MGRKYYSKEEAAVPLGVRAKTLNRLMLAADPPIAAIPLEGDRRTKQISLADMRRLASRWSVTLPSDDEVQPLPGVRHKPSWKVVLARIAELEARVAELEAQKRPPRPYTPPDVPVTLSAGQEGGSSIPDENLSAKRQQRAHRPSTTGGAPPFPSDWKTPTDLEREYEQLNESTLRSAVLAGRIHGHQGRWKRGSVYPTIGFDPEQVLEVLQYYNVNLADE